MRYKVQGMEIRSENTARSNSQASKYLVGWLRNREVTPSALDYGCGKLRYTMHLAQRSSLIGIVDSSIQLRRKQLIFGEYTSIEKYLSEKFSTWIVQAAEEFWERSTHHYHFMLCANVLSAIPCQTIRAKSLRAINQALLPGGCVLFVNQHTNSSFSAIKNSPSTYKHLNGWITKPKTGASYYGIMTKDIVVKLSREYGFSIQEAWIEGQSNFVLASKG